METISTLLKKFDTLPASPALLPRLAQTLSDFKYTDIHEVVDIIVFDSALTAKLLQIANSAYFGNRAPLTNVGDAISQLGYDIVFRLAAAICGSSCLKASPGTGLDSQRLWKHSVIASFGAQHVAQTFALDGNLAFTAGLLHDLGKVVLAEAYGRNYTSMLEPVKRGALPLVEWEAEEYGCSHADVGAALLENWKLPKPLVISVKHHHHPAGAAEYKPLAACICLGTALAHAYEDQTLEVNPASPEIAASLKITGLAPNNLRTQWTLIQEKWEFVQTLCDLRM